MSQKYVMGNWKMQGDWASGQSLLKQLSNHHLAAPITLFMPALWLPKVTSTPMVQFGAQDVSAHAAGAYTGEISATMLAEEGIGITLVGHSERRQHWQESHDLVAKKAEQAQQAGLKTVICVGETQADFEANQTEAVLSKQLLALKEVTLNWANVLIAYEPVWAIGTGLTAKPEQAQAIHHWIKGFIADNMPETASMIPPVLYGGSVKGSNAQQLFEMPDIDGALIGGASWDAEQLIQICEMAN